MAESIDWQEACMQILYGVRAREGILFEDSWVDAGGMAPATATKIEALFDAWVRSSASQLPVPGETYL